MPPGHGCPPPGLASPEVTRAICLVPSASFPQAPRCAPPVHLCRFRVRSTCWGCFPGCSESRANPLRRDNTSHPSPPAGPGLFARFPSTTAFALALGAGSPRADEPCAGTLGLPATGTLAPFVATHVSIRTPGTSRGGHPIPLRRPAGRSATAAEFARIRQPAASARGFRPVTSSARGLC